MALARREVAVVGEAKWAKKESASRMITDIRRKADDARLPLTTSPIWIACARDVLTHVPPDCLPITAHDIFA